MTKLRNKVEELARSRSYNLIAKGKSPNILVVGEYHGFFGFDKDEKDCEIIRLLRPDFVLHEGGGCEIYVPGKGYSFHPRILVDDYTCPGAIEWGCQNIIPVADEIGFTIVGNDLSMAEIRRAYRNINGKEMTMNEFPDWAFSESLCRLREERMAERLLEYVNKSSKPLISIHGLVHTSQDSLMVKNLNKSGIEYILLDLDDREKIHKNKRSPNQ